jgi:hypothetical protein
MKILLHFNQQANLRYSNLPVAKSVKPFEAYPVEASAAATPGNIGYNTVTEDFTHTVFIEEGTATWCPDCPAMGHALYDIYESSDYQFYYVALVEDMDTVASNRVLNEYNLWGYPTAYIDGGYEVLIGGIRDEEPYRELIESSGQKDVHEFDMALSVEWIGNGELEINISITNNEEITIPIYEFGEVTGGLMKVKTTVGNIGVNDATNVDWSINIQGGLLQLINKTINGQIETLNIGNQESITANKAIIGVGEVNIIVLANEAAKVEKGFVFGPFIIVS